MLVYRITKAMYANRLVASGGAARWSRAGQFVMYTAATRALACLENVVHRSGEGLTADFRVMVIEVPNTLAIEIVSIETLPDDWFDFQQYGVCQRIGGEWLQKGESVVLRGAIGYYSERTKLPAQSGPPRFSPDKPTAHRAIYVRPTN